MAEPGANFDPAATPFSDIFDADGLNDVFGGDTALLQEMVILFESESAKLITAMRGALAAGDGKALERAAHKIKGSIGSFSAKPAYQSSLELEQLGKEGVLADAAPVLARLESDLTELQNALKAYIQQSQ